MEHLQFFITMQSQSVCKDEIKAHIMQHKKELTPVIDKGTIRFDAPNVTYLPAIYSVCCCTAHEDSCELLTFMIQEFPDLSYYDGLIRACLFLKNYEVTRILALLPGFDVSEILEYQTDAPQEVLEYILAVATRIDDERKSILRISHLPDDCIRFKYLRDPDGVRRQLRIKLFGQPMTTRVYCLKLLIDLKIFFIPITINDKQ